jgi:serine protease DegQ
MLKRLWLTFAQVTTVCTAVLFVISTLRPDWISLGQIGSAIHIFQNTGSGRFPAASSYHDAAQRAMPAVVNIFTSKDIKLPPSHPLFDDPLLKRFFDGNNSSKQETRREKNASLGSGVIVSPQGYILTNQHVIEAADEIEVALADGRQFTAKTVGVDPETDLAVLQIDIKDAPAITFGKAEQARVGDVVLAIGNPFGVGQTVTMGIVSALGRSHLGINTFENFIQTDAAINPGNSGGALTDSSGHLLGINTAIYSKTGGSLGIGFAIPVSTAQQVMEQIIATGSVTRGYIGVEPQDITPELVEAFKLPRKGGAIIAGVMRGGPADKSGIKVGDILIAIDGKPIKDTTDMLNTIAQLEPTTTGSFKILRNGKPLEVRIPIGKRPKPKSVERVDEDAEPN